MLDGGGPIGGEIGKVADTDWATGAIRIFARHREWADLISSDPAGFSDDELVFYEAVTHEATHRLQLVSTGFAYDLSREWFYAVAAAARDCADLDAVNASRARYLPLVQPLLDSLLRAGEHGITPLSIMEGAAFYAEITSHRKIRGPGGVLVEVGPRSFDDILNEEAPSEFYRIAYDVAVQYLAEEAFDKFPHIANLALYTSEPEVVFIPLLEKFGREASRMDDDRNHEMGIAFLKEDYESIFLGSADDVMSADFPHPVLDTLVKTIRDLRRTGAFDPVTIMAHGQVTSDELAAALQGPMLFLPEGTGQDRIAPMVWPGHDLADPRDNPLLDPAVIRMLAATSQLLLQDTQPLPDRHPRNRSTLLYGASAGIHMWRFTAQDRTPQTIERIGNTLNRLENDPHAAKSLRGSVAVVFPESEFPGSAAPLLDPGVQAFLRKLFIRVPYLLYYLIDDPFNSAIMECVAAFAPDALSLGSDGELRAEWRPELTKVLGTLMRNAMAFAAAQGQPGLVVMEKLRRLPPQAQSDVATYLLRA
ncbi:MAG: hypothetical protein ACRDPY_27715 [Streptosporangiaceae bacterium]